MHRLAKSPAAKRRVIIAAVSIAVLIILARPLGHYAHSQALSAVRRGDLQPTPQKALPWYKVAASIAPHDPKVLLKLASADVKTGRDDDALRAAARAIDHGAASQGYLLKSQALLEMGNADTAAQAAAKAVQFSRTQEAQTQLGLSYAVGGDVYDLSTTIGLLGASKAAQTLDAARHDHLSLAQELYVLGLLRSSERVLQKYQVESSQFYLLKAQVTLELGSGSKQSLEEGRGLLEKGIAISPERIDLRQLLQGLDQKLGDTAAAHEQGSKIKALQDGRV